MVKTQPGGLYQNANGQLVDANGNPAKRQGAPEEEPKPFDLDTATKAELVAEAERRGLTEIKRTDGGDGDLRAEDYRAALK